MKARLSEEKAIVRSAASSTSEVIGELHAGDEITLGDTVKDGGTTWCAVTLPTGMAGFVPGDIKVFKYRDVFLQQDSVNVLESPADGSKIKMTYNEGDRFTLTGKWVRQEGKRWAEVRVDSGEMGYIPEGTRITKVMLAGGTRSKKTADTMFKESDYVPFMLGVFLIGGLVGIPLAYGRTTGLSYFESLPWALASCVVFLIAFRRNGTISWGRAIPAIVVLMIGASIYNQSTGRPAFAAGGVLGFLLVMVCGYVGIGIGRVYKRTSIP